MAAIQEAIRRLTVEAKSVGVDKTTADLNRMTAAQEGATAAAAKLEQATEGLAVAEQKTARARQSTESSLNSIQRKYDAQYRAQMELATVERKLMAAQSQGLITIQRRAELLSLAAERHGLATSAIEREVAATNQLTAANTRLTAAMNDNVPRAGGGHQTANIAAQFQDIGVTAAMGMSPLQIALQQGTQLSMVLQEMQNPVRGLAAAFVSLLNPVSLITIGVIAAGVALYQYFTTADKEVDQLEEAFKRHEASIRLLKDAYGDAAGGAREYLAETREVAKALTVIAGVRTEEVFREQAAAFVESGGLMRAETESIRADIERLSTEFGRTGDAIRTAEIAKELDGLYGALERAGSDALVTAQRFKPFETEIQRLIKTIQAGSPDFIAFRQEIAERINLDPTNRQLALLGDEVLSSVDSVSKLQSAMRAGADSIATLGATAAANVGNVMQLSGALQALGAMIPNIARAQAAQDQVRKANEAYQAGVADLNRQMSQGSIRSESAAAASLERLNDLRIEAVRNVTGLASAEEEQARRARDAQIGSLKPREQALARLRDQYAESAKAIRELADTGVGQAKVDELLAANSRTLEQQLANTAAGFEAVDRKAGSRGAAKALKDAEREMQSFVSTAQRLADVQFPGSAARREAEELAAGLAQYGAELTDLQRIAVQARIDDQFKAASLGVRELAKDTENAASEMASTLADTFTGLFTEPMKDADALFKKLADGFARIGENNLQKGFDQLFSGKGLPGFSTGSADFKTNSTLLDVINKLPGEIQKGAADGTAAGAETGLSGMFQGLFTGKSGQMINAGLGGIGMGYQSQDPLMGALGGALQGLMTGNPVGAVVGGIAGLIGGLFGQNDAEAKKQREAAAQLSDSAAAIAALIDQGMGRGVGAYRQQSVEYTDELMDVRRTARKAGDRDLIGEVDAAIDAFNRKLREDFVAGFRGTIEAMESGLGASSPFVQAQSSIIALRDELKNFIADADWAQHGMKAARVAARDYALSVLTGAEELSPFEAEMQRVKGTAAGLKVTLAELGMSSEQADKAIRDGLKQAIGDLRDQYRDDVGASINDLSGKGYLNDMADAQKAYNDRLKDAEALGISAGQANREFALSLSSIALDAGLSAKELRDYAHDLGIPPRLLKEALKDLRVDRIEQWRDTMVDLQGRLADARGGGQGLNAQIKAYDRIARLERDRLEDADATARVLRMYDKVTNAERRRLARDFEREQRDIRSGFEGRRLQATVDPESLTGQLKLFDLEARLEKQRLRDAGASKRTLLDLERTLGLERNALVREYNKQQVEEQKQLAQQQATRYQDLSLRLLKATTDTETLAGALKIFDAERAQEIRQAKLAGETARNMAMLEKALAAERQAVIDGFNRRSIDEAKSALDEALGAFRTFAKGIRDFRDDLRLNADLTTLSPRDQLGEARRQYEETLALANRGDRDAMSDLTSVSQTYLEQAKGFYASTEAYAQIFDSVNGALVSAETNASKQVSAAERQIDLLSRQISTLETVNASVLTVAQVTRQLSDSVSAYFRAGGRGFAGGGYTGDIGVNQVAGQVHGREYVSDAQTTARYRPQLEAMSAGTFRPQIVVSGNDNSAGFANLSRVMAAMGSEQVSALREVIATLEAKLDALQREIRVSGDKKMRASGKAS